MKRLAARARLAALLLLPALLLSLARAEKPDARKQGSDYISAATLALQKDDAQNPAMLWMAGGEAAWSQAAGASGKSCASCHGDAKVSMRGVAARHPTFDANSNKPLTLAARINQCRVTKQGAQPWKLESEELLGMEAYLALQSRGMKLEPANSKGLQQWAERGRVRYQQKIGQLNFSCAQCHDQNAGGRLGSALIPQAHPTGYPIYRLEWQSVGSVQRRLRNCMNGVRAQPFALGSDELLELEVYLAERARGMLMEAPGVRP